MDIRKLQFRPHRRFKGEVYIRQLFSSWHRTLRRYERAWGSNNLAYVYNEQAQVGLLAIAAEKAKGLPLLEFSVEKHCVKGDYVGRADLSILRLETEEEIWVEAEPAIVNSSGTISYLKSKIRDPFKEAKKCVKNIKEAQSGDLCLAIVFVRFKGASTDSFDAEATRDRLYKATNQLNADFCAVHFCNPALWTNSPHPDCPGIAVVGKAFRK